MSFSKSLFFSVVVTVLVLAAGPIGAATITIVPGAGFDDPTVVDPVGGNPGTTLGEQRLIVVEFAAEQWGALIESDIEILVSASFGPFYCDDEMAVFSLTAPASVIRDFANAPFESTWYPIALANALAGSDMSAGPDINAIFNSNLDDDPMCLVGQGWHYGFDRPLNNARWLYPVVLHELGHGLGFQNFVNEATGSLAGDIPDIFTRFTLDMTTGKHWNEMDDSERMASAINSGEVVWDGQFGKAASEDWMAASDIDFIVNSPEGIAGTYETLAALFGAGGALSDIAAGDLELVNDGVSAIPSEGCGPLVGFTPGRIAFIDRGSCLFGQKSLWAQQAGATAVVIANDRDGTDMLQLAGSPGGELVTIPVVMIGENDGNLIRPELPGVNLTLDVLAISGTHSAGYPLLHAPNQVDGGSSISHWDASALPNALMEPFGIEDRTAEFDITLGLFSDIGWTVIWVFESGFESGGTTLWSESVP